MADSSLDDFFAKKDKSKKKSKSKMTPTDVLAKADEGPKKEKKKKDKEQPGGLGLSTTENTSKKRADDEEWADFEEQKEVDYTGLRIQTLQMSVEEAKDAAESDGDGEGREGEEGREGASGPWNSSNAPAAPAVAVAASAAAPPPPPETEEKKENTAPKKYVSPALRHAALNPAGNPISRRSNKKAPNIQSEEDFPTLGGGPQVSTGSAWGAKKYESSSAGDIESNPGHRRGGNLSLENKFAALQE